MELIIIFLVVKAISSLFSNMNKQDAKSKSNKKDFELRRKRIEPEKKDYRKNPNSAYGSLASVLNEVKKSIEEFDEKYNENTGDKSINNQKSLDKGLYKFEKNKKSNMAIEDKTSKSKLKPQLLVADAMADYERALYGEDHENPMFDYNYSEIENGFEDEDDLDLVADLFEGEKDAINFKQAMILKEILDKPLALRKS